MRSRLFVPVVALFAAGLCACTQGSGQSAARTTQASTAAEPEPALSPEPAISSAQQARLEWLARPTSETSDTFGEAPTAQDGTQTGE